MDIYRLYRRKEDTRIVSRYVQVAAWPSGYRVRLVIEELHEGESRQGLVVDSLSKKLYKLLSNGWFQERIRECVYKLQASYTIELK